MRDLALQSCLDELQKIAEHLKEARVTQVPKALQGLVRPEMGPKSFQRLLKGYREGLAATQQGLQYGQGRYAQDAGFLTHDTRSFGGMEAMEDALRHGRIRGSTGLERAQYTQPGLREVYWHRGFPGMETDEKREVTRMWFRGPGAEGFHAPLALRKSQVKPDSVNRVTGQRHGHIARTAGPYDLQAGDTAVLSAAERKNLPNLLRQVDERGLNWSDSAMQQEALRQAQLESRFRHTGLLDADEKITDLDPEEFAELLQEALPARKGSLPRNLRWWRSAKAPTTSSLEAEFMRRIRAPYE